MTKSTIEESLQKHYAQGPMRYNPGTLEPLSEEDRHAAIQLFEINTELIREGLIEVIGERNGRLVYAATELGLSVARLEDEMTLQ